MAANDLPEDVARLFWEVSPETIDRARHADYVIERVMSRGGHSAMRWLRATYSKDQLADFMQRRGMRLAPRDRSYWCLISGVKLPIGPGGGRPSWAGP